MESQPVTRTQGELLTMVREIALTVSADAPQSVTKRAFNEARGKIEGCPDASNLCRRFKSSWPALLDAALREGTGVRTVRSRSRAMATGNMGVSKQTATHALAIIANRLEVRTLRPADYEAERNHLLANARGDHRRALEERLPTVGQLEAAGGRDWDRLLSDAGLERRARYQPRHRDRATTFDDAIELFLTEMGYLPNEKLMLRFADERDISFQRERNYTVAHERIRAARARRGLWTPPRVPPRRLRPEWIPQAHDPASGLTTKLRRNYWTLELVMTGLQQAARQLQPGQELTMITLRALSKTDDSIPSPSIVQSVGKPHSETFGSLRDKALREAQRAAAGQTGPTLQIDTKKRR